MRVIPGIALAMLIVPAAMAQAPAPLPHIVIVPPCAPPAAFADWRQRHPVTAATRIGSDAAPELMPADPIDLALASITSLVPATPLGKSPAAADHGGLIRFHAIEAATYRIALGNRAWIDVVRDGAPIASVAHAMGPACAGIAKTVDFRLDPGRYIIQLSSAADPVVPIAIARLP